MNTKIISYVISNLYKILIVLFLFPLLISIYYQEGTRIYFSFIIPIIILGFFIYFLSKNEPKDSTFFAKEGFVIVSLSWIFMSIFGALPFFLSGYINNITDSFFESVSGFTTTGASILSNIEILPKSLIFWRSFTHLVGGMGVLVLVLAILPKGHNKALYIMRAEVPGPNVGKVVSKMSFNSRLLYIIYLSITFILIILLMIGGMDWFDACIHAFGTAGTGGFSSKNISVAYYNSTYIEYVLSVSMLLFALNFNLFYLLLLGNIKQIFKSEEAKSFLLIVVLAITLICINLYHSYSSITKMIRDVIFTVSSVVSTTGFSTVDFGSWPLFSQLILLFLMFMGGCSGSTAGGFKVARLIIIFKKIIIELKRTVFPNKVIQLKLDDKTVDRDMIEGVNSYFILYLTIFFTLLLLVSLDSNSFMTAFSAVAATFNNIGPGLDAVGPTSNFSEFSSFTKIVLSLSMLLGRLEIIPLLILLSPKIYNDIN